MTDIQTYDQSEGCSHEVRQIANVPVESCSPDSRFANKSKNNCVVEWYIKDTGEIFLVDWGLKEECARYPRLREVDARVFRLFDVGCRFLAENEFIEEAYNIAQAEVVRIKAKSLGVLAGEHNGFDSATVNPSVPRIEFEKTPHLGATVVEEHYLNLIPRAYDEVSEDNLSSVYFKCDTLSNLSREIIYGMNYAQYYEELLILLKKNDSKIIKMKNAKSVQSWIFADDMDLFAVGQYKKAFSEKNGRDVCVYHLLDVRKYLISLYGKPDSRISTCINSKNSRIPFDDLREDFLFLHDRRDNFFEEWNKGADLRARVKNGKEYYVSGLQATEEKNFELAISFFDRARELLYLNGDLYKAYLNIYQILNDHENIIDIATEALEVIGHSNSIHLTIEMVEIRRKAIRDLNGLENI